MLYRSDDITYCADVDKLYQISNIVGKEVLAVVYRGGTGCEDKPFNENGKLYAYLTEQIERGSEIALHGYDHKDITSIPVGEAMWELVQAKKEIESLLEVNIRYYVPPYHRITKELTGYIKTIGMETLCDDGEDLAEVDHLRVDTKMVWYHWWNIDLEKLTKMRTNEN